MTQEEYNSLLLQTQPHSAFNTSWGSYNISEFGETFLPNVNSIKENGMILKDGAKLFNSRILKMTQPADFSSDTYTIFCLTYPQGASANDSKKLIEPRQDELGLFFEVHPDEQVTVHTLLNDRFRKKMASYGIKNLALTHTRLTTINDVKDFFNNSISQSQLASYVLEISGLTQFEIPTRLNFDKIEEALKGVENDFDAGKVQDKKHPHSWAHGDIEARALFGTFKEDQIQQIYYGNWLRDYSSVITASTVGFSNEDVLIFEQHSQLKDNQVVKENLPTMGSKLSQYTWSRIIKVIAVKEFRYNIALLPSENYFAKENVEEFVKRFGEMTQNILGLYRPEEHIDNPKGLKDESIMGSSLISTPIKYQYEYKHGYKKVLKLYAGELKESLKLNGSLMKPYIKNDFPDRPSSLTFVKEQLTLAYKHGRKRVGFRHLGAAFHVMEDYFAHTNFVEIALIKRGYINVHPWVELSIPVQGMTDGAQKACEIPLVTGLFGSDDMIASMAPKIANEFFPTDIQRYKSLKAGQRTFFDTILLLILGDYITKDKSLASNKKRKVPGTQYTYEEVRKMYRAYLITRDMWLNVVNNKITGYIAEPFDRLVHTLTQGLKLYPNILMNELLRSTADGIKLKQATQSGYGSDPTHTQLAKDPVDHFLNPIAGKLAFIVVKEIGIEMNNLWLNGGSIETVIQRVENELFQHPCDLDWIDEHIDKWASENPNAIKKAESKTVIDHYHQLQKQNIKLKPEEIKELYEASIRNSYS